MDSMGLSQYGVLIIIVAASVRSGADKPKHDFQFLGVVAEKQGRSLGVDKQSIYFLSKSTTTWNEAVQDCQLVYGETGTLLTNLNEGKFKYIQNLIRQQVDVGTYWIGGFYDPAVNNFVWVHSEDEVTKGEGWAHNPWDPKMRNPRSPHTKMVLVFKDNKVQWNVGEGTQAKRYICEVAPSKDDCVQNADTVFVVDNSLTVSFRINAINSLINKIITAYKPFDRNRFGMLLFNDGNPVWVYNLNDKLPLHEIEEALKFCNKVGEFPYCVQGAGTNILPAIKEARKELLAKVLPGVPLNMIILTRGATTASTADISALTKSVLNDAINIFLFAAWSQNDTGTLSCYTGGKHDRVFRLAGSKKDQIHSTFEDALPVICDS